LEQPFWLIQDLTEVMVAEGEVMSEERDRTAGNRIPDPGDRDDRQFTAEVAAAGLPLPGRE
jgi:hypothetical protein